MLILVLRFLKRSSSRHPSVEKVEGGKGQRQRWSVTLPGDGKTDVGESCLFEEWWKEEEIAANEARPFMEARSFSGAGVFLVG